MQCLSRVGFRCRAEPNYLGQWMSCRYRSGKGSKPKPTPRTLPPSFPLKPPPKQSQKSEKPDVQPALTIQQDRIIPFFKKNVSNWINHPETLQHLTSFGLPPEDSKLLLNEFDRDVQSDSLSGPKSYAYYGLERFGHTHDTSSIQTIYSTIFFSWASKPDAEHTRRIESNTKISSSTVPLIKQLATAMNRQFPTDEFERARKMHRKIIMHVGPTNSGKTHHALKALAAAKSGIYAGPLRLLAHEIWERLNTGQIVPLGIEEDPDSTHLKGRQSKYARLCNLVTGEEQKILDTNAPILSCTVEMIVFSRVYDVAVVDEIQMIGDLERGGAWFTAVAGLAAHEVHLCGEETAVPLVEKLLKDTGDELIIRRYERLTPLVIEDESLGGDLTKVRKGDCIVTFSRSSIFGIKRQVEELTGLRCAVVYGRLPPEVRSEQAALFNDPDSGYDVIIGSDAIGMGLNLKIRRVIFQAVSKYTPGGTVPLSVSTTKQIAGRAGRYGLHDGGDPGGTCTTLYAVDHSFLRQCLATPFTPLEFTRIGVTAETVTAAMNVLPPGTSLDTVVTAHSSIGRIPTFMRYSIRSDNDAFDYVDRYWTTMNIADRLMLLFAPIPWRDFVTTGTIKRFLDMHSSSMSVDFMEGIKDTSYLQTMLKIENVIGKKPPRSDIDTLMRLESFHKVIVFYVWMSFRNPVVYSELPLVSDLKLRLEKVLNWSLDGLSKNQKLWALRRPFSRPMDSAKYLTRHQVRSEKVKDRQKPTMVFDPTQNVAPQSIAG